MERLRELLARLDRMDDSPGWLSGDRELVAQLCRVVSEIGAIILARATDPNGKQEFKFDGAKVELSELEEI